MIKDQIVAELGKVLKKLDLGIAEIHLEHPENPEHGDYSSNIAMAIFSQMQNDNAKFKINKIKTPLDLAKIIVKNIPETDYLEKIEIAKPGFINFWLSPKWLIKQLGRAPKFPQQNKKIMVEFAHPNTHKPFHIGHLRNITLGESICRILAVNGFEVIRANYQGDIGLHIAKCLWGIGKLKNLEEKIDLLGKAYRAGNKAYEEDEKAKQEIISLNRKIYVKDSEIRALWKETRQWSLDYFERIYQRLDTQFDRYYFESEVAESGKKIVLQHLNKVFAQSESAIIFDGEKYGLHKRVFINKLGFPTYEAKEMGLAKLQFREYNPDLIVHVVGPEQKSYFQVVFKVLELIMPETKGKEYHRVYGWVRLKKTKMASRLGKVVLAEWLLDEAKKRLLKEYQMKDKVAEVVAVAAVKYSMLKLDPLTEIAFDIDESINLEGNSGPYLQYTYARARSVLRKGQNYNLKLKTFKPNKEEMKVLRTIYKFPEIILEAGESYAPNIICNFLYDLAQKFNLFYNQHRIIGSANEKFRLALTGSVSQILKNGLNTLGIIAPEKM